MVVCIMGRCGLGGCWVYGVPFLAELFRSFHHVSDRHGDHLVAVAPGRSARRDAGADSSKQGRYRKQQRSLIFWLQSVTIVRCKTKLTLAPPRLPMACLSMVIGAPTGASCNVPI